MTYTDRIAANNDHPTPRSLGDTVGDTLGDTTGDTAFNHVLAILHTYIDIVSRNVTIFLLGTNYYKTGPYFPRNSLIARTKLTGFRHFYWENDEDEKSD